MTLKINKWMGRKLRNEKNGTAAKNKRKKERKEEKKWQTAEKRNAKEKRTLVGGMLDASNAPLHGRKRISDMNGNAEGEQVFVLSKT